MAVRMRVTSLMKWHYSPRRDFQHPSWLWYRLRDGTLKRPGLRTYLAEQRAWLRDVLARGAACRCAKTAALCRSLWDCESALWTFAHDCPADAAGWPNPAVSSEWSRSVYRDRHANGVSVPPRD